MRAILLSTTALLVCNSVLAVTTLSGPERTPMCPGQTLHYTCTTSSVSSITWQFYCPGTDLGDNSRPTRSIDNGTINDALACTSNDNDRVTVSYSITFQQSHNQSQSSIGISAFFSLSTTQSFTIDCEESRNYRFIDLEGLPPIPNDTLTYFIEQENCNSSHVPTTLSWPQQDEEPPLLYLLSIAETNVNTTDTSTFRLRQPIISLLLKYDAMYTMTLRASRCEFQLNGTANITRRIQIPPYQGPLYPELNITEVSPGVLSYQCREGLVPEGIMTSVCGRDGIWIPHPSQYNCTPQENETTTTGEESGNMTVLILAGGVAGVVILLLISVVAGAAIILIRLKAHLNTADSYPVHAHTYESQPPTQDPTHSSSQAPQTNTEAVYAEVQSPHNEVAVSNHADRPSNSIPPHTQDSTSSQPYTVPDTGEYSVLRGHWPVSGHTFPPPQPHPPIHTETPPSADIRVMTSPYAMPVELDHTPHSQTNNAGKQNEHATSVTIYNMNDAEEAYDDTITMDTTQSNKQRKLSGNHAEATPMKGHTYSNATPTGENTHGQTKPTEGDTHGETSPTTNTEAPPTEHTTTNTETPPPGVHPHAASSFITPPEMELESLSRATAEETLSEETKL